MLKYCKWSHRAATFVERGYLVAHVYVLVLGLGASPTAGELLRLTVESTTGEKTIVIPSVRFSSPWPYMPALELQAFYVAAQLRKMGYANEEDELHVIAHSLGVPIALVFATRFAKDFGLTVRSFTGMCPAGVYRENVFGLMAKIARKVVRDLWLPAGRLYWLNSLRYFANPLRALREGWEVSRFAKTGELLRRLKKQGVTVKVALAPDDDVFSFKKTIDGLKGIFIIPLLPGTRHSPDYQAERLVATLRRRHAL